MSLFAPLRVDRTEKWNLVKEGSGSFRVLFEHQENSHRLLRPVPIIFREIRLVFVPDRVAKQRQLKRPALVTSVTTEQPSAPGSKLRSESDDRNQTDIDKGARDNKSASDALF